MQVKQKIMKGDPSKNRYNLNQMNYDSTPGLPQDLNKENNPNVRNHHRPQYITEKPNMDLLRSMDVQKRLRTSANEQTMKGLRRGDPGLMSSQELFHFRKNNQADRHGSANFGEHLTFGEVSRRPLMTSRDFQQEKAIKNEVIDELISNARRELCKSFNEFSGGAGTCANHTGKKAKYRLVAELSEGEEEMFYCSKCAINLLQQGFPIEEMRPEQPPSTAQARAQQVAKLELKLRALQDLARSEEQMNDRKDDLELVQEEIFNCNRRFGEVFEMLEAIRKDRISSLSATYNKLQAEKQGRREGLQGMLGSLGDLHREIQDYRAANRFSSMRENQFNFLATSLANKLAAFQEALAQASPPSPRQRLSLELTSTQGILEKLRTGLQEGRKGETSGNEEFACDQLKKPFRILFPNEECEGEKRSLLNSVRECPSFGQYPS